MRRNRRKKSHWRRDVYYRRLKRENDNLKKRPAPLVKEIKYVSSYMGNVVGIKETCKITYPDFDIPGEYIKELIKNKIAKKIGDYVEYESYKGNTGLEKIYEGRLWIVTR